MKKIILAMMACAGLCACTNEEVVGPSGTTAADELSGEVAYITVNIKDVGSSTRAGDGGFAYGTADEQNVANAYFYFYDDNGNYMARGSVASVIGTASSGSPVTNIEWESNTVVAVWGLTKTGVDANGNPVSLSLPSKMVTVLNQPSGFSGTHLSLTEMQAALAQATNGYADGNGNFVMSTSSYDAGGTTGIVNYTALTADNFSLEPIDLTSDYGEKNPAVNVYVERLAAKVSVVNAIKNISATKDGAYNLTELVSDEFAIAPTGGVYVQLLGWDINGTSRDSYMLKNINDDSNWGGLTFVWNGAANYRSYWAESPNYGITHTYPTSSDGNTDADENTAGLDVYLKYTSLSNPIALGSYGYCAENTNTTAVLGDASSTGITNLLVKAQAYTSVDDVLQPLDLVKFHGEYYTAKDFCNQTVSDVVTYDINTIVEEVIEYLKNNYSDLSDLLDALNAAIVKDAVWYGTRATSDDTNEGRDIIGAFDGNLLSLYNTYDGKVTIYFNMTTQPQWGNGTTDNPFTNVDPNMANKYPSSAIVYNKKVDLDNYDFYFHIDGGNLNGLVRAGLVAAGLVKEINGAYYLLLGNAYTVEAGDDNIETGKNHLYTLRNYFLRAITRQADAIDGYFGSLYPVYYAGGLMYYAIPIEHLGTTTGDALVEGQYGVVRNHWYNISLNEISNLGHGIADEDEVIVPQPEEDFYYLGATVNILSWHMINQSASLK